VSRRRPLRHKRRYHEIKCKELLRTLSEFFETSI
jgi:hypothetical protein